MSKCRLVNVVLDVMEYSGLKAQGWPHPWQPEVEKWQFDPLGGAGDLCELRIPTSSGEVVAAPGDFIMRALDGEFRVLDPEAFARTYELVEE